MLKHLFDLFWTNYFLVGGVLLDDKNVVGGVSYDKNIVDNVYKSYTYKLIHRLKNIFYYVLC